MPSMVSFIGFRFIGFYVGFLMSSARCCRVNMEGEND